MSYQSPSLYHRGKKGELRVWHVWTVGNLVCSAGGLDGGKLTTHRYEAKAKNVGRANATNPEQQADKEAAAMFEYKLARKYSLTREEAAEAVLDHLPMLAKDIKKGAKPVFPALCQRKYNGFRCQARKVDGEIVMTSKSGVLFELPHIAEEIAELPEGWTLDGEIYIHGKTLQQISSLIKRPRPESRELMYVVYDVIDDKEPLPQFQRHAILASTYQFNCQDPVAVTGDHCVMAQTYMVGDLPAALKLQQTFLADGYEGAILRNLDGKHQYAVRSNDLIKLKVWEDDEFEIVDVIDKKIPGLAIFVCRKKGPVPDGRCFGAETFEVVKKGTHESRREDFKYRDLLIGHLLTVRYAELTKDGIPFQPVGLHVREEWD